LLNNGVEKLSILLGFIKSMDKLTTEMMKLMLGLWAKIFLQSYRSNAKNPWKIRAAKKPEQSLYERVMADI